MLSSAPSGEEADPPEDTACLLAHDSLTRAWETGGQLTRAAPGVEMAHSQRRSVAQMSEGSEPDLLPVSAMLQAKRALRVIHKIEQARGHRRATGEAESPSRPSRISFAPVTRQGPPGLGSCRQPALQPTERS